MGRLVARNKQSITYRKAHHIVWLQIRPVIDMHIRAQLQLDQEKHTHLFEIDLSSQAVVQCPSWANIKIVKFTPYTSKNHTSF